MEQITATLCASTIALAGLLWTAEIATFIAGTSSVQAALFGAMCAMAYYGHMVIEGPLVFSWLGMLGRAAVGGVFGILGAKGAEAAAMSEAAQTAAAMVVGGTGPKHIDRIADRVLGAGK